MQIEGTEGPIIITEGAMGSTDEAEVTEDNLRQVLQKPTTSGGIGVMESPALGKKFLYGRERSTQISREDESNLC